MILLINTFLTEKKDNSNFGTYYDTGLYKKYSNIEIFKYSLLSLNVIRWSEVFINYDLQFKSKKKFNYLNNFIKKNFDNPSIENFQIKSSSDWNTKFSKIKKKNNLVFLACDHDHILINYNKIIFKQLLNQIKSDELNALEYSHWQPSLRYYSNVEFNKNLYKFKSENKISFTLKTREPENRIIANQNLIKKFLLNKNKLVRRPDETERINNILYNKIIPKFEISRHFHGYSHIGMGINEVSPLFIPKNIFKKNPLKVFYSDLPKKNCDIYINTSLNYNSAEKEDGSDWQTLIEGIPTFWKKRVILEKKIINNDKFEFNSDLKKFYILKKYLNISDQNILSKFKINFFNLAKIKNYLNKKNLKINKKEFVLKRNLNFKSDYKIIIVMNNEPIIKKIDKYILTKSKKTSLILNIMINKHDFSYEKIKFGEINNIDEIIFYKNTLPKLFDKKKIFKIKIKKNKFFFLKIIVLNFLILILR